MNILRVMHEAGLASDLKLGLTILVGLLALAVGLMFFVGAQEGFSLVVIITLIGSGLLWAQHRRRIKFAQWQLEQGQPQDD